ncbi:MAG: hypothetical protein K8S15_14150 [Candidatus Aegiribacteria sp.]|nr:hypothetical protein [Candidatus Aegiribacteria sp.]
MKYLLMMLMVITAAQVTASGVYDVIESLAERAEEASASSEVEVVELFHAETTEELEAALTDGYPMPWLEEILNDESIPEEDRYWLDCRMRAVLAQQMHLFYNREGNPLNMDAEFVVPGEDYWRENFIVNPPTEDRTWDTPDMPSNMYGEPGTIVNRFGEEIGNIALASGRIKLSRDASVGLMVSGGVQLLQNPAGHRPYACFFYPDGSFDEIAIPLSGMYQFDLSADGSLSCFGCSAPAEELPYDGRGISYIAASDKGPLSEIILPCHYGIGPIAPAVSPEGKYTSIPLKALGLGIYSLSDNELITFNDNFIYILDLEFSPDEELLCVSPQGYLLDSSTLEIVWDIPQTISGSRRFFRTSKYGLCTVVWETTLRNIEDETENLQKIYWNQTLIHETTGYPGEMGISPNGYFVLQSSRSFLIFQENSDQYTPFIFRMVREVR